MADASTPTRTELTDRVRRSVAAERGIPFESIWLESRLLEDLGMEGDDASRILPAIFPRL
jgi:hypothetical protein